MKTRFARAQRGTLQPRRGDRYVAQGKASPRATPWVTPSSKHLPLPRKWEGAGGWALSSYSSRKKIDVGKGGKSREIPGKGGKNRPLSSPPSRLFPLPGFHFPAFSRLLPFLCRFRDCGRPALRLPTLVPSSAWPVWLCVPCVLLRQLDFRPSLRLRASAVRPNLPRLAGFDVLDCGF